MLSKNKMKFIKSLHNKKNRNEKGLFLVEWEKSLLELLSSDFKIYDLILSEDFYLQERNIFSKFSFEIATSEEISSISTLQTNTYGIACVYQKENAQLENNNEYILILDDIKDPGNFGTIIRIADWYGIKKIICSHTTVEYYNPKVIHASMGSFTRVEIFYTDIQKYLQNSSFPIYWAFISGKNIHTISFEKSGYIVIGNESNGINSEIEKLITKKITIPRFWSAESLNAAIATGIILDNIRR